MRKTVAALLAVTGIWWTTLTAHAAELRPFVPGSWASILKEHAGRPFVVHFWGLTCGPCRTEMPELGRLAAERKDLTLVTVNADLVQDSPAASSRFLTSSGLAAAENWLFSDAFTQKLYFEINPAWQGEIPATVLVDRAGKFDWITGAIDSARVRSWLDQQQASQ